MSVKLREKYRGRGYTNPHWLSDALMRALGLLFGRPLRQVPPLQEKTFLCLNLGGIGDLSFTIPVLRALRAQLKPARIIYVGTPRTVKLFAGTELVDAALGARCLEDELPWRYLVSLCFWRETFSFLRILWRLHPQVFINFNPLMTLPGTLKYGLVAFFCHAKIRVSLDTERRAFFANLKVADPGHLILHDIKRMWAVAERLGMSREPPSNVFPYGTEHQEKMREFLRQHQLLDQHPLVIMHPGGGRYIDSPIWTKKRWGIEKFAELIQRLRNDFDARVVVVGSAQERVLGTHLASLLNPPPVSAIGETTLPELVALMDMADVVISNDSGIMHLAAGLDTALFAIFGFTDWVRIGPWGPHNYLLKQSLACMPCVYWFHKRKCPGEDLTCLRGLAVDQVYKPVKEYLAKSFSSPST